jgi:methylase of polypeptide subunit release factors
MIRNEVELERRWQQEEIMDELQTYKIGKHKVELALRDGVGPASPYSLLLAENIPDLSGQTVVDVGTGSGLLAIVARLQGAKRVYLLDIFDKAIALAMENAKRNGVWEALVPLPTGESMLSLPKRERVNVVLSNPAQLPLPEPDRANSPFYAGPDGRSMIDALINETPDKLLPSGRLLMTHNSMANLPRSFGLLESIGLEPKIIAELSLAFRPFINRAWLDTLGGTAEGLYSVRDGIAYESVCVLEARLRN